MPAEPDFRDPSGLPERWKGFLLGLDERLERPVELHCLGGFVVTVVYGIARDTDDLDALAVVPGDEMAPLLEIAGLGSELSRKFQLFVEQVGVADYPDSYEDRLVDLWPDLFARLRLRALEIHDVAVAKIARNKVRSPSRSNRLRTTTPSSLALAVKASVTGPGTGSDCSSRCAPPGFCG